METTHGLFWSTNVKGHPYEDRFVLPLGDFPNRLERATSEAEERRWSDRIEARKARGLVYAVIDGVGSAPRGREAAEVVATRLRDLYLRKPPLPPTWAAVRTLLDEANGGVAAWGVISDLLGPDAFNAGSSQGAAAVTAVYFSPQRNVTVLHVGDTVAYHYAVETERLRRVTEGQSEGAGISGYVGMGTGFALQIIPVDGFEPGDLLVLVTDGVVPKGLREDGVLAVLTEVQLDPERAAAELGTRARARRSEDDITALVVRLDGWE